MFASVVSQGLRVLFLVCREGRVRFPSEFGGMVVPPFRRTHSLASHPSARVGLDVMSGGHCTHPTGGPTIRLKQKKKKNLYWDHRKRLQN